MNIANDSRQKTAKQNGTELALILGRTPFERRLIFGGYASPDQIQLAVRESKNQGISLIEAIEIIVGGPLPKALINYHKLLRAYELSLAYGLKAIDLKSDSEVDIRTINHLIDSLGLSDICRSSEVLPIQLINNVLTVGMVYPGDAKAFERLVKIISANGLTFHRRIILKEDFANLLVQVINLNDRQTSTSDEYGQQSAKSLDQDYPTPFDRAFSFDKDLDKDLDKLIEEEDSSIVKLIDQIFEKAIKLGATEIILELNHDSLRLRFRVDGDVQGGGAIIARTPEKCHH
jgi:Type II secretion system (T2SS), protein E, N-terminal domain